MNAKQWIMISTLAVLLTFNNGVWKDGYNTASAAPLTLTDKTGNADTDARESAESAPIGPLEDVLGVADSEELYEAIYEGRSLAEVAYSHRKDVNAVIRLQVGQLTQQLDERLSNGSISADVYEAQKQELYTIVADSVYGR